MELREVEKSYEVLAKRGTNEEEVKKAYREW